MRNILTFVGMPGSGKGTCTDYLAAKDIPVIHFGKMVVEELHKRGLELTPQNEKIVREDLRKQHGKAVLAMLVSKKIDAMSDETIVLDGLYSWTEYTMLQEKYGEHMSVIAIFTPRKLRYERAAQREYRPLTFEEAAARDVAEIENLEKGGPIARADYTLINDGTTAELHEKLEELLAKIR